MNTYKIGLYEKAIPSDIDLPEKLVACRAANYDFLEISIDETDEKLSRLYWDKENKVKLFNLATEIGIPIRTMCLSGSRRFPLGSNDDTTAHKGVEIIKKAIEFAIDSGIRIIQIAGYDVYYETSSGFTQNRFSKNLAECVDRASQDGVILAFETMETEFMDTTEKAMAYVARINSPYLQIYPDIGNVTNACIKYNKSLDQDIRSGTGHIVAAHLKESKVGKYRDVEFGTGHVDFESAVRIFRECGVTMYVAEFWHNKDADWRSRISHVNHFLRQKFA